MHPILLDLPQLHVRILAAEVLRAAALGLSIVLGPHWAARLEGLDPRAVRQACLVLALMTLAGARLHFILNHPSFYADQPLWALALWTGPFHIGGGVVAVVLTAPAVTRHFGMPLGKFGDGMAPAAGLALAVNRLGCLLHGCCFGTVCEWPWCITFPFGSSVYLVHAERWLLAPGATHSAPVHPLQLYFAAVGLLITMLALWLHPRKRYDGQVVLTGLLVFSVSAALLEGFREEYGASPYWGPLSQLTWTGLAMTLVSLAALVRPELEHRRRLRVGVAPLAA